MAMSFNKKTITEAIQEVLAENTGKLKTVTGPSGKTVAQVVTPEEEMEMKKKGAKIAPMELKMGIKVEMEHTNDPKKAEKIALQHLAEDPKYYTKLTVAGLEEGPHDAMNPGILSKDSSLKGEDGKIKISKVRQKLSSMKDKGSTKAKALRRFINYHD